TADGFLVYAKAHASGGTVLHRPIPEGTEDFITFDEAPKTPEVTYRIVLGGAERLRLFANTLEILDTKGAPRLRVSPPYLTGADGAGTEATLAVEGCAADTDPAPPWDRPVTALSSDTCTVRISWANDAVVYPALLDPTWTTTGAMANA